MSHRKAKVKLIVLRFSYPFTATQKFTMKHTKSKKFKVHMVSGTHWDREWRFTAEQSKLRLADLVDGVIEKLEADPDFRHYMLDGGAVVLEDYMSVRPEMFERLKALVSAGRTPTVAWYTLPYARSGVQQFVLDLPRNLFDQDFTRLPTGVATP